MPYVPPGFGAGSGPSLSPLPPAVTTHAPVPAAKPVPSSTAVIAAADLHNPVVPQGVRVTWRHVSQGHKQALEQIRGRQNGSIMSIRTPWNNFNDVGMDGLEWQTMMVVAARPGIGKSLVSQLITNNAHALNPEQDFMILDFQFEMLGKNMAMRELSSHLGLSLKQLNSAEKKAGVVQKISNADVARAQMYCDAQQNRQHFVVEQAQTAKGIGRTIENFYKVYKRPFIVTIDHSMLVLKDATEKDKIEMLQNLGAMITDVKRRFPVIVIVLSQLNRTIEDYGRQEKPGTAGNYPNDGDIFGSDALLQHTDILCILNRPAKYNLAIYGPDRYRVTDPNLLAAHFLKVRSGNPRISFFIAEYAKMNLREIEPPPLAAASSGRASYSPPGIPAP